MLTVKNEEIKRILGNRKADIVKKENIVELIIKSDSTVEIVSVEKNDLGMVDVFHLVENIEKNVEEEELSSLELKDMFIADEHVFQEIYQAI
ncbi:MAG: hypothetical protein ACOCP8_08300 [archaeon]